MKKVLIISYFFPPSNFVGAERTAAWYKYLPEKNIYPIIITRQWNKDQTDITSKVSKNMIEVEKNDNGEIHRLPVKWTLRDQLAQFPSLWMFQKTLTFIELVLSNFFINALPYSNIYFYTKAYIQKNKDIKFIIASGRPFQSFFIGYKLKKDFPNLVWIPDYRDEWNTHQQKKADSFLQKIIFYLEKRSELKWTSNAEAFLSVSLYWVNSIASLIKKQGVEIKNGFIKSNIDLINKTNNDFLTIGYFGSLYPYQPIEDFINKIIELKSKIKLQVYFVGTEIMPDQEKRVKQLTEQHPDIFILLPRLPKEKLIEYYQKMDLLYLTKYENIKGWYPVKLFDYYNTGIPILLFPSDKAEINDFLTLTNCGYIANTNEELDNTLNELYRKKNSGVSIKKEIDESNGKKFSRQYQTHLLADFLNTL